MKETILQAIRDYAPVVLFTILMFIDRFGFGTKFGAFLGDVKKTVDISSLTSEIKKSREDLASAFYELKEVKEELAKVRESISRIKGSKK